MTTLWSVLTFLVEILRQAAIATTWYRHLSSLNGAIIYGLDYQNKQDLPFFVLVLFLFMLFLLWPLAVVSACVYVYQ